MQARQSFTLNLSLHFHPSDLFLYSITGCSNTPLYPLNFALVRAARIYEIVYICDGNAETVLFPGTLYRFLLWTCSTTCTLYRFLLWSVECTIISVNFYLLAVF